MQQQQQQQQQQGTQSSGSSQPLPLPTRLPPTLKKRDSSFGDDTTLTTVPQTATSPRQSRLKFDEQEQIKKMQNTGNGGSDSLPPSAAPTTDPIDGTMIDNTNTITPSDIIDDDLELAAALRYTATRARGVHVDSSVAGSAVTSAHTTPTRGSMQQIAAAVAAQNGIVAAAAAAAAATTPLSSSLQPKSSVSSGAPPLHSPPLPDRPIDPSHTVRSRLIDPSHPHCTLATSDALLSCTSSSASILGVFEILVNFETFKNIDLFRQGMYTVRCNFFTVGAVPKFRNGGAGGGGATPSSNQQSSAQHTKSPSISGNSASSSSSSSASNTNQHTRRFSGVGVSGTIDTGSPVDYRVDDHNGSSSNGGNGVGVSSTGLSSNASTLASATSYQNQILAFESAVHDLNTPPPASKKDDKSSNAAPPLQPQTIESLLPTIDGDMMLHKHKIALPYYMPQQSSHTPGHSDNLDPTEGLFDYADRAIYPAQISDRANHFYSRTFRIQYCDQEVVLNDGCLFRIELNLRKRIPVYMECELLFTEYTIADAARDRPVPPLEKFAVISRHLYSLEDIYSSSLHEFLPITFDDTHFSVVNTILHTQLIDFKFRLPPNQQQPVRPIGVQQQGIGSGTSHHAQTASNGSVSAGTSASVAAPALARIPSQSISVVTPSSSATASTPPATASLTSTGGNSAPSGTSALVTSSTPPTPRSSNLSVHVNPNAPPAPAFTSPTHRLHASSISPLSRPTFPTNSLAQILFPKMMHLNPHRIQTNPTSIMQLGNDYHQMLLTTLIGAYNGLARRFVLYKRHCVHGGGGMGGGERGPSMSVHGRSGGNGGNSNRNNGSGVHHSLQQHPSNMEVPLLDLPPSMSPIADIVSPEARLSIEGDDAMIGNDSASTSAATPKGIPPLAAPPQKKVLGYIRRSSNDPMSMSTSSSSSDLWNESFSTASTTATTAAPAGTHNNNNTKPASSPSSSPPGSRPGTAGKHRRSSLDFVQQHSTNSQQAFPSAFDRSRAYTTDTGSQQQQQQHHASSTMSDSDAQEDAMLSSLYTIPPIYTLAYRLRSSGSCCVWDDPDSAASMILLDLAHVSQQIFTLWNGFQHLLPHSLSNIVKYEKRSYHTRSNQRWMNFVFKSSYQLEDRWRVAQSAVGELHARTVAHLRTSGTLARVAPLPVRDCTPSLQPQEQVVLFEDSYRHEGSRENDTVVHGTGNGSEIIDAHFHARQVGGGVGGANGGSGGSNSAPGSANRTPNRKVSTEASSSALSAAATTTAEPSVTSASSSSSSGVDNSSSSNEPSQCSSAEAIEDHASVLSDAIGVDDVVMREALREAREVRQEEEEMQSRLESSAGSSGREEEGRDNSHTLNSITPQLGEAMSIHTTVKGAKRRSIIAPLPVVHERSVMDTSAMSASSSSLASYAAISGVSSTASALTGIDFDAISRRLAEASERRRATLLASVRPYEGKHVIVLCHGYQGSSWDMRLLKNYIVLLHPHAQVLVSTENENQTEGDIRQMGKRLAVELATYLQESVKELGRLSFVCHSLGGLIVRSAITEPELEPYRCKLYTYISLATPHCGYRFSENSMLNTGIWFLQKWNKSTCLSQLSLSDSPLNPQECFLVQLASKPSLTHFTHVYLVAGAQDRYAPYHSARIEIHQAAQLDKSKKGQLYQQMLSALLSSFIQSDVDFKRFDMHYAPIKKSLDSFIGRTAHINFLTNTNYMIMFLQMYTDIFQ